MYLALPGTQGITDHRRVVQGRGANAMFGHVTVVIFQVLMS